MMPLVNEQNIFSWQGQYYHTDAILSFTNISEYPVDEF